MTIDPTFFELMPTKMTWHRFTGEDAVGNNSYVDTSIEHVRVEPYTVTINASTAMAGTVLATVQHGTTIIMDLTTPQVAAGDLITLEGGKKLRVIQTTLQYDQHGPYYQELQCENNQEGTDV